MFECKECSYKTPKWIGQCPNCKQWGTFQEIGSNGKNVSSPQGKKLIPLHMQKTTISKRIITQSEEINHAFGGGIMEGSCILLSGEPGIGKSTFCLQLANWINKNTVYISGEESIDQICDRAHRLHIQKETIHILYETNLENILESLHDIPIEFLIIDSISVIYSGNIQSNAGSISQVRFVTETLIHYTKEKNITLLLIGHVNKEGDIAGPKILEHLVDTVVYFEGMHQDDLRILRVMKNRFGSTGEIGVFRMTEKGMEDISDLSKEFLKKEHTKNALATSTSIALEGNRAFLIEIESLVHFCSFGYPKRQSKGIPLKKLEMLLGVMKKYTKIHYDRFDVYINVTRGVFLNDDGIDLAIVASILAGKHSLSLPPHICFLGEVSLTGNIKIPGKIEKRIKEAQKIGMKKIVGPLPSQNKDPHLSFIEMHRIEECVSYILTQK